MKTQIKRMSKSALAVILTICMFISCMMVGTIDANAYSIGSNIKVYFINTRAWSNVYMHLWGNNWSHYERMDLISNTGIYYKSFNGYDYNGFNFTADGYDNGSNGTTSGLYEDIKSNKVYWPDAGTSTDFNKMLGNANVVSMIDNSGSGTYTQTSSSNCVAKVSGYKINSGSTTTTAITASTGVSSSASIKPVYASNVTYNFTASGDYVFKGYYTLASGTASSSLPSNVNTATTYTTQSLGYDGNANLPTVYAYFQKKETNYYVAGGTAPIGTSTSSSSWGRQLMTSSGTTYYRTYTKVPAGTYDFKITNSSSESDNTNKEWYGGSNLDTDKVQKGTGWELSNAGGSDNNAHLELSSSDFSDYNVTIYLTSNKKIYVSVTGVTKPKHNIIYTPSSATLASDHFKYNSKQTSASEGDTVTFSIQTDTDYEPSVTKDGSVLDYSQKSGNTYTYTFKMGKSDVNINVEAKRAAEMKDINYYVDMHGNNVTSGNEPVITITDQSGKSTLSSKKLTKQTSDTSESVYGGTVSTPYVEGNNFYVKITWNGNESGIFEIKGDDAVSEKDLWFEAINEQSTTFVKRESTTKKGGVATGKKRIYLKKPYNMDEKSKWAVIGLYNWRNSDNKDETDWFHTNTMTNMGQDSSGNDYYYYDMPSESDYIIFQGLEKESQDRQGVPQTEDIQLGQNNLFVLSTDGTTAKASSSGVIPSASKYTTSLRMNKGTTASIALTTGNYVGTSVAYSVKSGSSDYVTVDNSGNVTARKSTQKYTANNKKATIQIKIKGSFDSLLTKVNKGLDIVTIEVSVEIYDSAQIDEFSLMSYGSQETKVKIKNNTGGEIVSIDKTVGTGYKNGATYNNVAIVTSTGSGASCVFTIKYAKPEDDYSKLKITFETTSRPLESGTGERYGFNSWQKNGTIESKYTSDGKANTAVSTELSKRLTVTPNMAADGSTLEAEYVRYSYTDLHITYNYYEYQTYREEEGDWYYFYDPEFACHEDENDPNFEKSHIKKSYDEVVEVRGTGNLTQNRTQIEQLVKENMTQVSNNYYNYTLKTIGEAKKSGSSDYEVTVTALLNQTPRTYKVTVNPSGTGKSPTVIDKSETGDPIYYQSYVDISAQTVTGTNQNLDWRAVPQEKGSANAVTSNTPLLARGPNYRFRVTDNSTITVEPNTSESGENPKKKSTVTYSGREITHEESNGTMVEKLIQNFYIAHFFSKDMIKKEDKDGTIKTMDDVTFVGGGVVYYSVDNDGKPLKNTVVDGGYVESDGFANVSEITSVIQTAINDNMPKDYTGKENLTKIAYSTEIPAQVYRDAQGVSTGLVLRYLPYETFVQGKDGAEDSYVRNTKAYRYSNALGAYQYVYSAKAENKPSNEGKNMRLYSYYIYSYTDYDEDDKAMTVYDVVLSEQPADAETYYNASNNIN